MKYKLSLLVIMLAVFLISCATPQGQGEESYKTRTYRILLTAATAYNTAFQGIADLHEKGILTTEDVEKAVKYGELFWVSYHSAVNVLCIYNDAETAENKANMEKAMIAVTQALAVFNEFIHPLLLKGVDQ